MRSGRTLRLLGAGLAIGAALAVAGLARSAAAAATGRIEGSVVLLRTQGETVAGADAVVWLVGSPVQQGAAPPLDMASQDKAFTPRVVVVPVGGKVRFPNSDRIYHNVFSRTLGQEFDLGLYKSGQAKERRFDRPGTVQVYCNIHAQMAAHVLVVDGGITSTTDADGHFRLEGVPSGVHALRVWHEMGGEQEVELTVRANETSRIEVRLDATRWRPTGHKNKHGDDYPSASLDDDRY